MATRLDCDLLPRMIAELGITESIDCNNFYLGSLCKRGHDWNNTGYSLKLDSNRRCHECALEFQKRYQEENKEKIAERRKQYYQENKEKIAERRKQYYQENKERIYESRKANGEIISERTEVYNHSQRRYQRKVEQSDGTATSKFIKDLLNAAKKCHYCGFKYKKSTDKSIDHVVPLSRGGLHSVQNIIVCCRSCNNNKSSKLLSEWNPKLEDVVIQMPLFHI